MFDSFEFINPFEEPEPKPEPKPTPAPAELTDTDVDDIFKSITEGIETEQEVLAAAAKVIEAEAIVAQADSALKAKQDALKQIEAERAEAMLVLERINARLRNIKDELMDARGDYNRAHKQVEERKIQVEVAKTAIVNRRKFDAQEGIFTALARDKQWWKGLADGRKILPHQWTGARFLASAERAILGDGMGLGKTLTAIAALDLVQSRRALVICPADVASNFVNEIQMWAPHRHVLSLKGKTKRDRETIFQALGLMQEYVLVLNYEAWRRDTRMLEKLVDIHFDTVILDEAHNIKTVSSDAYKGCEEIALTDNICPHDGSKLERIQGWDNRSRRCPECRWNGQSFKLKDPNTGVELSAEERYYHTKSVKNLWCMTGTPILNQPADIYAPLSLIDPNNFYNRNAFLRSYCWLDEYTGRWNFLSGGLDSLKVKLRGRFLARTLEDTDIILPPQYPTIHEIEMDGEKYPLQLRTIQQLAKYAQIVLSTGETLSAMATIALITRQRQANVWPGGIKIVDPNTQQVLFNASDEIRESIKIDKAIEIICEAVEAGQRVALFSQFATALEELNDRLNMTITGGGKRIKAVRFDGSTPDGLKEQIKTNFNKSRGEEPKWDVVLANYKTGGVGLNLTAATHTIILDEEWNPGKRDQAYARTRRLGQDETTFVHVLRLANTVDGWLASLIENKEALIEGFNTGTADIQQALLKAIEKGEISG